MLVLGGTPGAGAERAGPARGRSGGRHYCACTCALVCDRRPAPVRTMLVLVLESTYRFVIHLRASRRIADRLEVEGIARLLGPIHIIHTACSARGSVGKRGARGRELGRRRRTLGHGVAGSQCRKLLRWERRRHWRERVPKIAQPARGQFAVQSQANRLRRVLLRRWCRRPRWDGQRHVRGHFRRVMSDGMQGTTVKERTWQCER
jgi:hypothetical protein